MRQQAESTAAVPLRRSRRNKEGKVAGVVSQWQQHSAPSTSEQPAASQPAPALPAQQAEQQHDVNSNKATVALKTGLHIVPSTRVASGTSVEEVSTSAELSGLWALLPEELIDAVLKICTAPQLAMLETTCTYFRSSGIVERIAKQRLKAIPRAKGLKPNWREHERPLGLLHFVNSQSAAAAQATAVACGAHHTAALLVPAEVEASTSAFSRDCKHSLFTFGRGFHGQLGTNSFEDSATAAPVTLGYKVCPDNDDLEEETMPAVVACGSHHTSSISRRGELFTWGLGSNGELGLGQFTPLELATPRQCYLSQTRIVSIAAGAHHTLAIAENGTLWSCGRNRQGQLGLNNLQDANRLTRVANIENVRVVSAAAGVAHSMALAADGSLYTWGDGRYGQLGHSQLQALAPLIPNQAVVLPAPQKIQRLDPAPLAAENRVTAIAAGAYHSVALTVGGALLSFGRNASGCLGTGDTTDRWKPTKLDLANSSATGSKLSVRVVQVACGAAHTVALVSNGGCLEVRTAGANTWGQLGLGDRKPRSTFTATQHIPGVAAVQSGDEHSMAITATGVLYVWGRGDSGQLGVGNKMGKWRPTQLKGFKVVHPDRTLRRNKRSVPNTRPLPPDAKRQKRSDQWHFQ